MLGDSITVGTEPNYRTAFAPKGITPIINASVGRSWTGQGQNGRGDVSTEGSSKAAKDAVVDDTEKIKTVKGIVVALGSNGGAATNPIADVIKALRAINPTARIWWVNTAATKDYTEKDLSVLGPFNKALSDNAAANNYEVIDWFHQVNSADDPTVYPTTDPGKLLSDGLHPSDPAGRVKLANVVLSSVTSSSTQSSSTGGSQCCSTASVGSGQIAAFASLPITSTWNISDSTAEQWFLAQAGARATKTRYGLNAGNIGEITSAVKAAGVSPVFFYAYTVNEGGGAGGFINHYRGEAAGGGVGNAKRDAEYLDSQSKIMDSQPSWVDAGNPVDFVPQDVKDRGNASFKSMPAGTIGRAYIPATAATTWEVYYPDGLKAEFNQVQNYGRPLNDTMQNIQKMGGNPTVGGATVGAGASLGSCAGASAVAGEGMEKAINWAKTIATSNAYGYDQDTRTTGWDKWQSDPNCADKCGNFDCSSFISAALTVAGYFDTNPQFNTGDEPRALERIGFTKVNVSSLTTSKELQAGDILIASGHHTALYIGNDQIAETGHDENHEYRGGQVGDQTGEENRVHAFYSYPWDMVYRAPK